MEPLRVRACASLQHGLHYFGPTETPFEGDIDDIHPTDDEIDWLVAEADYLLPGANIKRSDVLFAWAGVRPLTHGPSRREGKQHLIPVIHDLASDGLPGVLALTGGALMIHRLTGADMCKAVQARIGPSRTPQPLSYLMPHAHFQTTRIHHAYSTTTRQSNCRICTMRPSKSTR